MATNKPTITDIQDTFTTLVSNFNTLSLDFGATGRLNTNQDSSGVAAINELELGIRGTSNNLVATDLADFTADNIVSALHELDSDLHGAGGGNAKADLTTVANDIVSAINEIESVFDASTHEISAGTNQFDVTTGDLNFAVTGAVSVDASGDINLDADGGDVFFKDAGTTYGSLTNTSGNLIVKSGTTTALTFAGANLTTAGTVATGGSITVGGTKINRTGALTLDVSTNLILDADTAIQLKDDGTLYGRFIKSGSDLRIQSGASNTTALTFAGANATFAGTVNVGTLDTTATDVKAAINEHEADLGSMSFNTTASNVTAAINELHTELGSTVDSNGVGNIVASNIGASLRLLDSAVGNLGILNNDGSISNRTDLVRAINSIADDVSLLDSDSTLQNARLGSLVDLNAAFVGSERVNFVAALNALRVDVPLIYDENGTQLN